MKNNIQDRTAVESAEKATEVVNVLLETITDEELALASGGAKPAACNSAAACY